MSRFGKRSETATLARVAAPLAPKVAPYWHGQATGYEPTGWYFTPAGADEPVFLGSNSLLAGAHLVELTRNGNQTT